MIETSSSIKSRGFTLLELLASLAIIATLVSLVVVYLGDVKKKAGIAGCMANLRTIHVGLTAQHQDTHRWPEVPDSVRGNDDSYSNFWRVTLKPYGVAEKSWRCPTSAQTVKRTPEQDKIDIDYSPAEFGDVIQGQGQSGLVQTEFGPFEFPKQPWVVESGDFHGDGNLLITTSGETISLNEFYRRQTGRNPPWGK